MKKIRIAIALIFIISLVLGISWITHADTENQLEIQFEDTVLCNKIADELRAYKNNESDKAVNYLISSTDKTVTIDINNLSKIIKLNLSGSSSNSESNQITNLTGIGSFSALQELNLDYNTQISERINPQSNIREIYNLTNLKILSLAGPSIYNEDINKEGTTKNISKLTNLENLNLSSTNIFSNTLLNDLGGLSNLKKLNLSNNSNINDLEQIVTTVTDLNIDNTRIEDITKIINFTSLEKLSMGHNAISSITPLPQKDSNSNLYLNNLKQLNMDYMNSSISNVFKTLQPLNLESLSLRGNKIKNLQNLVTTDSKAKMVDTLKYLDLADNEITTTDGVVSTNSEEVVKKLNLTTLILTNNEINNIDQLQYLDTLTTLRLGNNRIQNIKPISNMKFSEGELELSNQRLSTWVYKNTNNSKKYQYMILPNIIQQTQVNGSLVYDKNLELKYEGCSLNDDRTEYNMADNLNVKIPCQLEEGTEVSVTVKGGLADGTVLKYTYEKLNDGKSNAQTFSSQNNEAIETLKFNDSNLDNAIYNYFDSNRKNLGVTHLEHIPYIININRGSVDKTKELTLSNLSISDIEGMQNFTKLTKLELSRNNIKTAEQIKYLIEMLDLNMAVNNIGDEYSFIENLTKLTTLDLSSNKVTNLENLQKYIQKLVDNKKAVPLQHLNMGTNEISDINTLENCLKLTYLDLMKNSISDLSALQNLTKLEVLNLSNNNISSIDCLSNLTDLNILYLDNNKLRDISIVNNLNRLQQLGISSNNVEDISSLSNRTLLKYFYANDNKVNDVTTIDNTSHKLLVSEDGKLELARQKLVHKLTNEENKLESVTISLPQLFLASQKNTSMFYTVEDLNTKNCELIDTDEDNVLDSVTIKPRETNGENAVVTIIGGKADKTTFTIGQPPRPTITYSPAYQNKNVKGSVEATITFSEENVKITNNNGSNKHKFTENGEFTFEYLDEDGFEEKEVAKVDWIDNEGPDVKIEFTHNEENHTTQANIISNEEMQSVEGWTLSEDKKTLSKIYSESATETFKVKDELGNETEVKVTVTINKPTPDPEPEPQPEPEPEPQPEPQPDPQPQEITITSQIYEITDNKKITKIQPSSTVGQFKNNITTNATNVKILDKNNNELRDTNLIGTGSKIKLDDNNIYTIIVTGDTNGDAKSDIKDILAINKHRLNKAKLTGEYLDAGDVNKDGKCDIKDILQINKFRLGKIKNL